MEVDSIILNFINCTSAAALLEKFRTYMHDAPNTDFLHESLHSAILNDKLFASQLLAVTIQLTSKKENRLQVWQDILDSRQDLLNKAMVKPFTWEKYFSEDITRRKKKNEKSRNESILHLHKNGSLSLFTAFHYPKTIFALLKLGADPFLPNSKGETLTLAIVASSTLNKSSRLHIMEYMSKKNLLQLKPSGPDSKSPLEVCVATRRDCLKFLAQVPGIEDLNIKGNNALTILYPCATKMMKYFSIPQLAKMLSETCLNDDKLVASQFQLNKLPYHRNFLYAIKEIVKTEPRLLPELQRKVLLPEKLVNYFILDGKPDPEEERLRRNMRKMQLEQFWGNTEFDLANLPAELLAMVTANLGSEDQIRLFSVSKALKEMMSEYQWQQMVNYDTPLLYKQLELNTNTPWREKILATIKSGHNWKEGKAIAKKLRLPPLPRQIQPRQIDEYWLASSIGKKIRLFNLCDGSQRVVKLKDEPVTIEFLTSSPYTRPSMIFKAWQHFGWSINDHVTEIKYSDFGVLESLKCLFDISDNRVLISPSLIYDINRQQTLHLTRDQLLHSLKCNPFNNTIIAVDLTGKLCVMDKELNFLTSLNIDMQYTPAANQPGKIDFIDEYTIVSCSAKTVVADIRNMKSLLSIPTKVHYNGAGRGLESMNHAGLVWNFKTLQSESCVVFPDGTRTEYSDWVCNSKMAVFSTAIPYGLNALLF